MRVERFFGSRLERQPHNPQHPARFLHLQGSGFRFWGAGFRVWGAGFRVHLGFGGVRGGGVGGRRERDQRSFGAPGRGVLGTQFSSWILTPSCSRLQFSTLSTKSTMCYTGFLKKTTSGSRKKTEYPRPTHQARRAIDGLAHATLRRPPRRPLQARGGPSSLPSNDFNRVTS